MNGFSVRQSREADFDRPEGLDPRDALSRRIGLSFRIGLGRRYERGRLDQRQFVVVVDDQLAPRCFQFLEFSECADIRRLPFDLVISLPQFQSCYEWESRVRRLGFNAASFLSIVTRDCHLQMNLAAASRHLQGKDKLGILGFGRGRLSISKLNLRCRRLKANAHDLRIVASRNFIRRDRRLEPPNAARPGPVRGVDLPLGLV